MEFPEDVLPIIREYARPRMKYIPEYNQIVRLLGAEWPAVKKKLETKDAESVLDQFAYYAEAVVFVRNAKDAIPILPEEHSYSDYMIWLVASRNYSAYVEVQELRKLSLLNLLK
jgi:hypothetical protein